MTLKELNETVKYFSEKGHTISHNLAFVGIALAWLFIKTSGEEIVLTKHKIRVSGGDRFSPISTTFKFSPGNCYRGFFVAKLKNGIFDYFVFLFLEDYNQIHPYLL